MRPCDTANAHASLPIHPKEHYITYLIIAEPFVGSLQLVANVAAKVGPAVVLRKRFLVVEALFAPASMRGDANIVQKEVKKESNN